MKHSTAMTIEFLRARLLSERSVSRAARQRADQLATRVMELEGQLKIVTIQRKKAEMAAEEVLAILETQGIGDLSELIDSSSDGEVPYDDTRRESESATASRTERSEVEDGLPGTEPEVSPSQGKSLYWKSHINSPYSHDKQRAKRIRQRQRRQSFMTTLQSSSEHQLGKSCRKIKQTDGGSARESEKDKPTPLDAHGDGWDSCSNYHDDRPAAVEASRGMTEGAVADISDSHHVDGDHNRPTEARLCHNGSGKDEDMERVLEKQAMLINQFQSEENAQREWEKKYNEKTISTLADYEAGNLTPENNSQSKKELSELAGGFSDYDEETTGRAVLIPSTEEATVESLPSSDKNDRSEEASNVASSTGSVPRDTTAASSETYSNGQENDSEHQQFDGVVAKETKNISQKFKALAPEHHGMITNTKQEDVMPPHDVPNAYPSNSRSRPHGNRTIEDASSATNCIVDDHSKLPKLGPQRRNQLQLQGHPSQAPSSSLGGVLEALQRAKLSLTQKLSKLPSPSQGTLALAAPTKSQTRTTGSIDGWDIPISSAGLFRLPTDSIPPPQPSGVRFYASGSSFLAYRPDVGYPTAGSYGYPNLTPTYAEAGGSRVVSGMGARDSQRYFRASSDLSADRTSFGRETSSSHSDMRNGMPPGDRYALHCSNQTRSGMRIL